MLKYNLFAPIFNGFHVISVPIHVVASFKKIKAVINSNSQLAAVLENSAKLVSSLC